MKGINYLKKNNTDFGILAVANLTEDFTKVVDFFVKELEVNDFDILIPDFTHDDNYQSISEYYIGLYDYWLSKYSNNVTIRLFQNIISSLLGNVSGTECLGYGPMTVITVDTNGNIGPTDTLKITKNSNFETGLNILHNKLSDMRNNYKLRWIIKESLTLPKKCLECEYCFICGGGYLPHRWSNKSGSFQHPSIYCKDLKKLIQHIDNFLSHDLILKEVENV